MTDITADPGTTSPLSLARRLVRSPLTWASVLLGVVIVLAQRHGPWLSTDSFYYWSAARSFAAHGHLTEFDGGPLVMFPPGLSLGLGALHFFGLPLAGLVVALNAVTFALTLPASYLLLRRVLTARFAALAAVVVTVNGSLILFNTSLLSDSLFLVLTAAFLALLVERARSGGLARRDLAVLLALVALGELWRFTGVALAATLAGTYLVLNWRRGAWPALWRTAVLGVLSLLATAAVALRNVIGGSGPFGPTFRATTPISSVPGQVVRLSGRLVVSNLTTPFNWVPSGGVLAVLTVLGALLCLASVAGGVLALVRREPGMLVVTFFTTLYWALLVYAEVTNTQFAMNARLAAPAGLGSLVLLAYALTAVRVAARRVLRALAIALALFIAVTGVVNLLSQAVRPIVALPTSTPTALERVAARLPATAGILTTDPYGIYWTTGRNVAVVAPYEGTLCPASCFADSLGRLRDSVRAGFVRYALFNAAVPAGNITFLEARGVRLTLDAVGRGYALYRVTP